MQHNNHDKITMGHGSGGGMMQELIRKVFLRYLDDPVLTAQADAAVLDRVDGRIAFTTDAFVVQPLFFPGGDIGKLAVCGTVNDLVAGGARPLYLSAAFILEEGLETEVLHSVAKSMAAAAREAGVRVVCGDTKVVGRGQCDQLFIATAGVGIVEEGRESIADGTGIIPGDHVILSGTLGDHGMAVLAARKQLGFISEVMSDCAPLHGMIEPILGRGLQVRFMRDPTRGGLAATLCEVAEKCKAGITIEEASIPVSGPVRGMCELYGFDPLNIANEGKMVIIAAPDDGEEVVRMLRNTTYGANAARIGTVTGSHPGLVLFRTSIGGTRIVSMPAGEQLPRIC